MARPGTLFLLALCTLIPDRYAAEQVADIRLFETVADGGVLNEEQRHRATELLDAWRASEAQPSEREDPRLGAVLEGMAFDGMLASEADRRVAAALAARARERVRAAGRDGVMRARGHAEQAGPGAGQSWLRDIGVVAGFAVVIVVLGVLLGEAERRLRRRGAG